MTNEMMDYRAGLGKKITALIKKSKRTQAAEAKRMGIAPSSLSDLCNGRRDIRVDMLMRLCSNFRVSADWLLGISTGETVNATVQSVAEYTGLSEVAIALLHSEKMKGRTETQDFVNYVLAYGMEDR